jgi:hypothetical protein
MTLGRVRNLPPSTCQTLRLKCNRSGKSDFSVPIFYTLPATFFDLGYTHPNFELRLLTVNDMIANSAVSHQLLQDFLNQRMPQSPVLFQNPSPQR